MRSWALLLAIACGGDPDKHTGDIDTDTDDRDDPCAAEPLTVQVGGGELGFQPLAPGAEVVMVHGPQGGWHVDVSGAVGNARQTISVRPSVVLVEGGVQIAGDQQDEYVALAAYDAEACTGQFWGRRAFVDDVPGTDQAFICGLERAAAVLSVEVRDPQDGRAVVDEVEVTLRVDPVDRQHSCH